MTTHLRRLVLIGSLGLMAVYAPGAMAGTCSERLQVCKGFCEKSRGNAPSCLEECGRLIRLCMTDGCWDSPIVTKQCGYTRR